MESIRPDHEIEGAFRPTFESDTDRLRFLIYPGHTVTEDRLDFAIDLAEDGCGEFRPREADIAASRRTEECFDREPGHPFSVPIHDPKLLDHVTFATDLRQQPHSIRNFEARSPKINDVAPGPQPRRLLDDRWREAVMCQPVGESRPCDSRTCEIGRAHV